MSVILTFSILLLLSSFSSVLCVTLIIVYSQIARGVRSVIVAMLNLGLSFDGSLNGTSAPILDGVVHFQREDLSCRSDRGVGRMRRDRTEKQVQTQEVRDGLESSEVEGYRQLLCLTHHDHPVDIPLDGQPRLRSSRC
jgi:hypothetical protein